ncbi:chorismate synthase [Rubricoccus marinus]|uniref:Chorismate synthase n=1 Tax=Rubricoccus marinus TaxID=716817 RepID=A0A259TZH7_9BACT|nr:chorismate synthase [Rubricoccus marinus]OZC02988.1 chorismate synthase [Rubricoccus marinus]
MIRYLTAGESHGPALVGIVEGMPAGVPVTAADLDEHLSRRWLGFGRGGRAKIERDKVSVLSGLRFSHTMGSPIALHLANAAFEKDRAGWPEVMAAGGTGEGVDGITMPRPGHADLAGAQKYGFDRAPHGPDVRPVIDRSSARETAMRVACCSVARQMLRALGIEVGSHVLRIGEVGMDDPGLWREGRDALLASGGARALYEAADASETRMLDADLTERTIAHIKEAKAAGDTLGGVYEVIVTGVPPGLGSYVHWDRRLDGRLAQAILSIQAQKAAEVGDGWAAGRTPGSEVHDPISRDARGAYRRESNHAGGVEGGVSNGMPIVVRGAMKPIPTLIRPLASVDLETGEAQPTRYERSDVTSVPAASTVAEATVAWTIAEALVERYGGDTFEDLRQRLDADRERFGMERA